MQSKTKRLRLVHSNIISQRFDGVEPEPPNTPAPSQFFPKEIRESVWARFYNHADTPLKIARDQRISQRDACEIIRERVRQELRKRDVVAMLRPMSCGRAA